MKLLITLLLVSNLSAGTFQVDKYTLGHFFGGTVLYFVNRLLFGKSSSVGLTFVEGLAYEVYVDGFHNSFPCFGDYDPRGADLIDALMVGAGGSVGLVLENVFTKKPETRLEIQTKSTQLSTEWAIYRNSIRK